jgi:C4-dicarboxylate transporter DctM subunit
VFYIIVTGTITRRFVSTEPIIRSTMNSLLLVGVILPLVTFSTFVQQNLSFLGLDQIISQTIIGLGNFWLVAIVMIIIMLISGSVLASVPNLLLTAPLLAGAAAYLGLSPLEWGIAFLLSDMIGFITPPYGLNLYVISGISGIDYMEVAKYALPYLGVLMIIWFAFFFVPDINFLAPT